MDLPKRPVSLSELIDEVLAGGSSAIEDRIRKLHIAISQSPNAAGLGFITDVSSADLESKVGSGCYLDAVLSLVGPDVHYVIERPGAGFANATILRRDLGSEVSLTGNCGADALISVIAACLALPA